MLVSRTHHLLQEARQGDAESAAAHTNLDLERRTLDDRLTVVTERLDSQRIQLDRADRSFQKQLERAGRAHDALLQMGCGRHENMVPTTTVELQRPSAATQNPLHTLVAWYGAMASPQPRATMLRLLTTSIADALRSADEADPELGLRSLLYAIAPWVMRRPSSQRQSTRSVRSRRTSTSSSGPGSVSESPMANQCAG